MSCQPTNCLTCYQANAITACADGLLIYFPEGTSSIRLTSVRKAVKHIAVTDLDENGYVGVDIDQSLNAWLEQTVYIKVNYLDECGDPITFIADDNQSYNCVEVEIGGWFLEGNTVIDPFDNCPPAYPTSLIDE